MRRTFGIVILSLALLVGLFHAQPAKAEFYVIPTVAGARLNASDIVRLGGEVYAGSEWVLQRLDDNGEASAFVVPAGKVLVVMKILVTPYSQLGENISMSLKSMVSGNEGSKRTRQSIVFQAFANAEYDFSPGLVIGPGLQVLAQNFYAESPRIYVSCYGYLAPDK